MEEVFFYPLHSIPDLKMGTVLVC